MFPKFPFHFPTSALNEKKKKKSKWNTHSRKRSLGKNKELYSMVLIYLGSQQWDYRYGEQRFYLPRSAGRTNKINKNIQYP